MTTTSRLTHIRIAGLRSLKDSVLDLGRITVLIGPNGSGKSNLLTALRLVSLLRSQSLRQFVGEQGGASALLHYGPAVTRELIVELTFSEGQDVIRYCARLGYAAGDAFVFVDEVATTTVGPVELSFGAGHSESRLAQVAAEANQSTAKTVDALLTHLGYFHFHDTSPTSPLRQNSRLADNRQLRSDGSNLAAFLYRLKGNDASGMRASWNLIHGLVRRVAPFIKELVPDLVNPERPEQSAVRLYWIDERDHRFDVHDLSDGTLRAIALFTALGQPSASRPSFITIDEPELGLHPAAIATFAALVRSVSGQCQVLVATQSPALLDEFETDEVVVVERSAGETSLRRLASAELAVWLDDYSLSELYDKNVLGGRP